MKKILLAVACMLAVLPMPARADARNVVVANFRFEPQQTVAAAGDEVTWTWAQGATDHNVTFGDGTKSATQATGSYSRTFSAAGSFPYQCTIHPGMNGSVTVR